MPIKNPQNPKRKKKTKINSFTSNVKRTSHVMQSPSKHLQLKQAAIESVNNVSEFFFQHLQS